MAYDKAHQMDFKGLELLVGKVTPSDSGQTAPANITMTWTTANPNITPDGTTVVANGGTPTVLELQSAIVELNAKVNAILALLR